MRSGAFSTSSPSPSGLSLITCRGGLLVQPHYTLADHPPLDIIVIPGGYGTQREQENPAVLDWIAARRREGALTTSVCTGAFLLGAASLLDGKRATTHWATIDDLRTLRPQIEVLADARVVDEGEIITSAGVSAGIDMALHVVARLHGEEIARRTARDMEYDGVGKSEIGSRELSETEMDEAWTCGKGLAASAELPAGLGEVAAAMAEVLAVHMGAFDLEDANSRREHEAYLSVSQGVRNAAAQLSATAQEMTGYRDLPRGAHDMDAMLDPRVHDSFAVLVARKQELLTVLQESAASDEELLAQMPA